MEPQPSPLEYATPAREVDRPTLDEIDGAVSLTFPTAPRWLAILPVVSCFVVASSQTIITGVKAWMLWHLATTIGASIAAVDLLRITSFDFVQVPILWAIAFGVLIQYHRWGRITSSITASERALVFWRQGVRRSRRREYAADRIADVRLKTAKDVFTRRNVFDLIFDIRGRWLPIQRRLKSRDATFARQVLAAFRRALRLPQKPDDSDRAAG